MANELLAVEGMTFKFVNPAHSGTVTVTATAIPNSTISTKVSCESRFTYMNNLIVVITNGSDGNITAATGTGTIPATAAKTLVQNIAPLRKGDQSVEITMTGTNPSPPPPTDTYITQVEIDDPGQSSVSGS